MGEASASAFEWLRTSADASLRCVISRGGLTFGRSLSFGSALGEILRDQAPPRLVAIASKVVKLGFTFPQEPSVVREELMEWIEWRSGRPPGPLARCKALRHGRRAGKTALGTARQVR
jgi:hypothetical protein